MGGLCAFSVCVCVLRARENAKQTIYIRCSHRRRESVHRCPKQRWCGVDTAWCANCMRSHSLPSNNDAYICICIGTETVLTMGSLDSCDSVPCGKKCKVRQARLTGVGSLVTNWLQKEAWPIRICPTRRFLCVLALVFAITYKY